MFIHVEETWSGGLCSLNFERLLVLGRIRINSTLRKNGGQACQFSHFGGKEVLGKIHLIDYFDNGYDRETTWVVFPCLPEDHGQRVKHISSKDNNIVFSNF